MHRSDCSYVRGLNLEDKERCLPLKWKPLDGLIAHPYRLKLEIICEDASGVIAGVTNAIASFNIAIKNLEAFSTTPGLGIQLYELEVGNIDIASQLIEGIRGIQGVNKVDIIREAS